MGHGELLSGIHAHLTQLSESADVFVREKGFSRFARETQALYKVIGISDLAAWHAKKESYHEIAPSMIKKLLTGNGKASKEDVASALEQYVGRQEYAVSDESDAVAAGVAWLIQTNQHKILHSTDP